MTAYYGVRRAADPNRRGRLRAGSVARGEAVRARPCRDGLDSRVGFQARRVALDLGIAEAAHDDAITAPHRVRTQPASFETFAECIDLLIGHAGPRCDYH